MMAAAHGRMEMANGSVTSISKPGPTNALVEIRGKASNPSGMTVNEQLSPVVVTGWVISPLSALPGIPANCVFSRATRGICWRSSISIRLATQRDRSGSSIG